VQLRQNLYRKLVIPAALKGDVLRAVADVGIDADTLWPDRGATLAAVAAHVRRGVFERFANRRAPDS
jgi:hypothetical protein